MKSSRRKSTNNRPPSPNHTYDGKYTCKYWWDWSEKVERERIGCYEPFVRPGDLVFDVGAHRGRKTLIFRWLGARVIAVEPLAAFGRQYIPEFWWKFESDTEVVSVGAAVSPSPEPVTIWVHKHQPYLSSVDAPWRTKSAHRVFYNDANSIARQVKTITLDALVMAYGLPQFVKVDVEGHENAVVPTLSQPVPAMNMEYHQDWIPTAAIRHMDGLAEYEWNYTLNNEPAFILPEWGESGAMLAHMAAHLTKSGPLSWGDLYCRQKHLNWSADDRDYDGVL